MIHLWRLGISHDLPAFYSVTFGAQTVGTRDALLTAGRRIELRGIAGQGQDSSQ